MDGKTNVIDKFSTFPFGEESSLLQMHDTTVREEKVYFS